VLARLLVAQAKDRGAAGKDRGAVGNVYYPTGTKKGATYWIESSPTTVIKDQEYFNAFHKQLRVAVEGDEHLEIWADTDIEASADWDREIETTVGLGWSIEEASETRMRLRTFEENWDAPGTEVYDEL